MSTQQYPKLVALTSPGPRHGKTTVASYLEHRGYVRLPFAGPLKAMLQTLLERANVDSDRVEGALYGDERERPIPELLGTNGRWLAQSLGTEWGRECVHQNLWVAVWRKQVLRAWDLGYNVVVDDMRFPNELAEVRRLQGKVVRVVRPSLVEPPPPRWVRFLAVFVPALRGHASEGQLNDAPVDETLVNATHEDYLRYLASKALEQLSE